MGVPYLFILQQAGPLKPQDRWAEVRPGGGGLFSVTMIAKKIAGCGPTRIHGPRRNVRAICVEDMGGACLPGMGPPDRDRFRTM
jgi:hypothetical protein